MVGYNPRDKVHLSTAEYAAAGAISGAATRAVSQPLDVLKIRFQLQVEPIRANAVSKYHGIFQALKCIIREEGFISLWKGHVPAQILSITYGITQYASFEILTKEIWQYLPETFTTTYRPLTHTFCGGFSGCVATAFVHPVDVLRTRFVAQGEPKLFKTLTSAILCMKREEGIWGFYRGLVPALAQIGPQMGLQFGLYSLFTSLWNKSQGFWPASPPESLESLICGSGSGLIAKFLVHPLDVIKKRLEVQGFEKARQSFGAVRHYSGLWHCMYVSVHEEGLGYLYKGIRPSLLKAAVVAGCNFSVYEQICIALSIYHKYGRV